MKSTRCRLKGDTTEAVEDGDTYRVVCEDGYEGYVRETDIDTRETYTRMGKKDKQALIDWVQEADQSAEWPFILVTMHDEWKQGSYGRRLGFLVRASDRDVWATSVLTQQGTAVGWWD